MSRVIESAERTLSTSKEPRQLTKREFIARVASWADRVDVPFRESLLNEYLKYGLVEPAKRGPNRGLRPTYTFGCSQYRRALQIVRLRSRKLLDQDAILINMFVSGYSIAPHKIREPIVKETNRALSMIRSPIRSTYADRKGLIPLKQMQRFRSSLGEQDKRFILSGLELPPELLIELVRVARLPEPVTYLANVSDQSADIVRDLAPIVAGLLTIPENRNQPNSKIENYVRNCTNDDLLETRQRLSLILREMRIIIRDHPAATAAPAIGALVHSWWQREILCTIFIATLITMGQNRN